MNVVLTQNYYNLMNSLHNTQDSGVPTEFSNSPDVDGGRNIITMRAGTTSNKTYHPTGAQKIFQLGKYGRFSSDATPTKVRLYPSDLLTYEERNCPNYRYAMRDLLTAPYYVDKLTEEYTDSFSWNGISFAPSEDTTPITRETTTANEDLAILSIVSYSVRDNISKNGITVSLKYEGSVDFHMNKIYIAIGKCSTVKSGPILLAGINLPNTVLLEPNTIFNLFIGSTSEFA